MLAVRETKQGDGAHLTRETEERSRNSTGPTGFATCGSHFRRRARPEMNEATHSEGSRLPAGNARR